MHVLHVAFSLEPITVTPFFPGGYAEKDCVHTCMLYVQGLGGGGGGVLILPLTQIYR